MGYIVKIALVQFKDFLLHSDFVRTTNLIIENTGRLKWVKSKRISVILLHYILISFTC